MQQKFPRFLEISEIPRAQRNGTLRPNSRYCTTRLVIVLTTIWHMERNPVGPIKLDHLQKCSQIFRSDQSEMIRSFFLKF